MTYKYIKSQLRSSTVSTCNLNLNVSKCNDISFTRKLVPIPFEFTVPDVITIRFDKHEDLGSYLTINSHS